MRDRMERPFLLPRVHVEGADVAGRRRQSFGHDRADDQKIAVEHTWRIHADAEHSRIAAFETLSQIYSAVVTELRQGLPRSCVERKQPVPRCEVDATVVAALPVHQSADA